MEMFHLVDEHGRPYEVELPDPEPTQTSAFIFAFAKSGSTLIHRLVSRYCEEIGVPTFSLFDEAFQQGIVTQAIMQDAAQCFKKQGYIYLGFRHFPNFNIELKNTPTILLARDPRDMLVSLYYSVRSSHVIPANNEDLKKRRQDIAAIDIDSYVIRQQNHYLKSLARYRQVLEDSRLKIYRYEDVIYEKEKWLSDLVDTLGLKNRPDTVTRVTREYDIFPDIEDESQHVRQVHPGNYKKKLKNRTIKTLNESLKDFLEYFDYEI